MDVVVQVNIPEVGVTAADGGVVLDVITALAPAVHPLAPVTVTEYVPAVVAEIVGDVEFPPCAFHKYVPPPLAVNPIDVVVQVNVPEVGVTVAVGGVVLDVITALAPAVHPLAPVTVTEYVPAVVAEIDGDVEFPPCAFHR